MDPQVKSIFESYPKQAKVPLIQIRALILEAAKEQNITDLEETLKWGEPAYLCKNGSTIRLGWSLKTPEKYFVYFNCKSKLVKTFREIFSQEFSYIDNRAIQFQCEQEIPLNELKTCFSMALNYHKIKNDSMLGWVS